jgi:hypothetical protein
MSNLTIDEARRILAIANKHLTPFQCQRMESQCRLMEYNAAESGDRESADRWCDLAVSFGNRIGW